MKMREKQFDYPGKNTVVVQGQPVLRGANSFLYEAFNGFCTHQWHCREQSCLHVSSKAGPDGSAPLLFLWFLKRAQNDCRATRMLCWHMNRLLPRGMEPRLTAHCGSQHCTYPGFLHITIHKRPALDSQGRCGCSRNTTDLGRAVPSCTPGLRSAWGTGDKLLSHWVTFPTKCLWVTVETH